MKRDQFTVIIPSGEQPTLDILYEVADEALDERLLSTDGFSASDIDAAFRLLEPLEPGAEGVFSLTHRLTGEYLIESNASADTILSLIDAARDGDDDPRYRVRIRSEALAIYDLDMLFVYDHEGELLRQHSLIPSGVEI